jgi:hypothetical protein
MDELRIPPHDDSGGSIVKARFQEFLQTYQGQVEDHLVDHISAQQRLLSDYVAQASSMIQNNKSTLYVNFQQCRTVKYENWHHNLTTPRMNFKNKLVTERNRSLCHCILFGFLNKNYSMFWCPEFPKKSKKTSPSGSKNSLLRHVQ